MTELSLQKQAQRLKASIGQKLYEAGHILEAEMHRLVAIDTGKLDLSIQTKPAEDRGTFLSVDVGSFGVFYASIVEYGLGRVFNYHRPPPPGRRRPVIYTGVGQYFMSRSVENKKDEIMAKLSEAKISGAISF